MSSLPSSPVSKPTPAAEPLRRPDPVRGVVWDDRNMKSSYANVCNVASTREEVVVVFGTNRSWKGEGEPVTVDLSERMILSPFAAKRLSRLLNGVIDEYERRFGAIAIAPTDAATAPASALRR